MKIKLNGLKYTQHCTSPDCGCYLIPAPTIVKIDLEKVIRAHPVI